MRTFKILDLFCGTGAFSKGFENAANAQYQTVFGIDLLKIAVATFKQNHPYATALAQDIRQVEPQDVQALLKLKRGDVDIIIGGPPCQGFSSIRPFRSLVEDDPRNSLFENFADFVNYFRPKLFIIENVVGLATHKGGTTIAAMEEHFYRLGYTCDWRIVNAAHFGVPQRRERLIFIGAERGTAIVFPQPTHISTSPTIGYRDKQRMLLPPTADLFTLAENLLPAVTVMDAIGDLPRITSGEEATFYDCAPVTVYQSERRKNLDILTLHSSTKHTDKMLEIIRHSGANISSIPKHLITSGFSSCYSRLAPDEPAVTITVNFVHPASNRCIHPLCDRALTPREGARLQSFDDDFIFVGNRSQVTKQIGNAVPPLLGRAVGEALAPLLS